MKKYRIRWATLISKVAQLEKQKETLRGPQAGISVGELAGILGVPRMKIHRWIKAGRLEVGRVPKKQAGKASPKGQGGGKTVLGVPGSLIGGIRPYRFISISSLRAWFNRGYSR
jgi:hypothetical protein